MYKVFLDKLQGVNPLSEGDAEALRRMDGEVRRIGAREQIRGNGPSSNGLSVVLEGFAYRAKTLGDGRRQIVSYMIPGDMCAPASLVMGRPDYEVHSLSPVSVGFFDERQVCDLMLDHPNLSRAFIAAALAEIAISREWIVSLGQRTALERVAHLICEVFHRMRMVNLTRANACEFPLTQTEIGDMVGLSTVHVNRTLQDLRRSTIELKSRTLVILDLERLKEIAMFDPAYLRSGSAYA